jgi:hypothetical protein
MVSYTALRVHYWRLSSVYPTWGGSLIPIAAVAYCAKFRLATHFSTIKGLIDFRVQTQLPLQ